MTEKPEVRSTTQVMKGYIDQYAEKYNKAGEEKYKLLDGLGPEATGKNKADFTVEDGDKGFTGALARGLYQKPYEELPHEKRNVVLNLALAIASQGVEVNRSHPGDQWKLDLEKGTFTAILDGKKIEGELKRLDDNGLKDVVTARVDMLKTMERRLTTEALNHLANEVGDAKLSIDEVEGTLRTGSLAHIAESFEKGEAPFAMRKEWIGKLVEELPQAIATFNQYLPQGEKVIPYTGSYNQNRAIIRALDALDKKNSPLVNQIVEVLKGETVTESERPRVAATDTAAGADAAAAEVAPATDAARPAPEQFREAPLRFTEAVAWAVRDQLVTAIQGHISALGWVTEPEIYGVGGPSDNWNGHFVIKAESNQGNPPLIIDETIPWSESFDPTRLAKSILRRYHDKIEAFKTPPQDDSGSDEEAPAESTASPAPGPEAAASSESSPKPERLPAQLRGLEDVLQALGVTDYKEPLDLDIPNLEMEFVSNATRGQLMYRAENGTNPAITIFLNNPVVAQRSGGKERRIVVYQEWSGTEKTFSLSEIDKMKEYVKRLIAKRSGEVVRKDALKKSA